MSQRDGFTGGFITGAIFGGIIGGAIGALLTSRRGNSKADEEGSLLKTKTNEKGTTEESIEFARRKLEKKIAQLNLAIDDVREQLGAVNGNVEKTETEESI
ncbi:hypothetical protein [Oscillatoria salina]|uniref:hypothetical protein n=1 Tax=Oscillatoria salina TaxID=331517 RepID=UPI0013B7B080|nr:hypothetical protein [Oscillatoria salina]MBZ8182451.1 hypothetical protein [Oscillatoria salina IIICB1]NET90708.1 hypothetical protein [Kamptonema sp. SIO1D9]